MASTKDSSTASNTSGSKCKVQILKAIEKVKEFKKEVEKARPIGDKELRAFYETIEAMPSEEEIKNVVCIMQQLKPTAEKVKVLLKKVDDVLAIRDKTLQLLQEAIDDLNKHHLNVNIAKVRPYKVFMTFIIKTYHNYY